jgi:beta-mannanase
LSAITWRRNGARSVLLALAATAALAAGSTSLPVAEAATPTRTGILLGVAGDLATVKAHTGQSLAAHNYANFSGRVEGGQMLTLRSSTSWKATAAAAPGSALYADIVRWADALKVRGSKVFMAFHHEPEAIGSTRFGTAADFKAAFRRVVTIFRSRGAKNVIFTWQATDWAFRVGPSARVAAAKWYPGDAYVDVIGADAYNWYTCGEGKAKWNSMKTLLDPVIRFARAHGKQVSLPEFGVLRHAARPSWITDTANYLAANDDIVTAAFYFQHQPTNMSNRDCTWPLSSAADFSAFRNMAARATFTG